MASRDEVFKQGYRAESNEKSFVAALNAAVDYRGDTTLELKDGKQLDGFLYNFDGATLELFPIHSPQKEAVSLEEVSAIVFSGKDTSLGKSWEDWMAKKEAKESSAQASS